MYFILHTFSISDPYHMSSSTLHHGLDKDSNISMHGRVLYKRNINKYMYRVAPNNDLPKVHVTVVFAVHVCITLQSTKQRVNNQKSPTTKRVWYPCRERTYLAPNDTDAQRVGLLFDVHLGNNHILYGGGHWDESIG